MDKHIFIYADEYKQDVWEHYCDILNVPYDSYELKVFVSGVEVMTRKDECD